MDADNDGDVDLEEFANFFSKRKVDRCESCNTNFSCHTCWRASLEVVGDAMHPIPYAQSSVTRQDLGFESRNSIAFYAVVLLVDLVSDFVNDELCHGPRFCALQG